MYSNTIRVIHEWHGISNHPQHDGLLGLTSKTTSKLRITDPVWGEPTKGPTMLKAFPSQDFVMIFNNIGWNLSLLIFPFSTFYLESFLGWIISNPNKYAVYAALLCILIISITYGRVVCIIYYTVSCLSLLVWSHLWSLLLTGIC